ncbi:MAG: hypothetical protein RBS73_05070 [Prolixibacteraceae bacterium]|jgi:hypothetical protein|nr:hypothetical protein [Prolixibacteraceae bacterium]
MKIIYNKREDTPDHPREEKETHLSRLIKKLDTQDEGMDPEKRKRKWMYILALLFFLYLVSFLAPIPELKHQPIDWQEASGKNAPVSSPAAETQKPLTFDMPVDSFETILKKNIHESIPEKK